MMKRLMFVVAPVGPVTPSLAVVKALTFPGAVYQKAIKGDTAALAKLKAAARAEDGVSEDAYGDHQGQAFCWGREASG